MWQHVLNIVLGLIVVMVALVSMEMNGLAPMLTLTFGLLGIVIAMVALGGFFSLLSKQPRILPGAGEV